MILLSIDYKNIAMINIAIFAINEPYSIESIKAPNKKHKRIALVIHLLLFDKFTKLLLCDTF